VTISVHKPEYTILVGGLLIVYNIASLTFHYLTYNQQRGYYQNWDAYCNE